MPRPTILTMTNTIGLCVSSSRTWVRLKAVDSTMVRPHNNWDFSLHHVVCRSHLASHLGHKQQADIPFSDKPWRDRNRHLFSHPLRRVTSNGSAHAPAISRVFPKPVTSGPVIMVVTRAMITSMVKMCCERMSMS